MMSLVLHLCFFLVILWSKQASKPGAYVPPGVPKHRECALKKIHNGLALFSHEPLLLAMISMLTNQQYIVNELLKKKKTGKQCYLLTSGQQFVTRGSQEINSVISPRNNGCASIDSVNYRQKMTVVNDN